MIFILYIIIALSICLAAISLLLAIKVVFSIPSGRAAAIQCEADGFKDIIAGTIPKSFDCARTDIVENGLKIKRDKKTGVLHVGPRGTFSHHAVSKMMNR